MKNKISCFPVIALILALVGCGLAAKEIELKSQSEKMDVYKEIAEEGAPPRGFSDLVIKASVKSHVEGYYFLEPSHTYHGLKGYPFLINIDGQAQVWRIDGQKEVTPIVPGTKRDVEAGEGVRYVLDKKIRLSSGPHKFFFSLPGENYYTNLDLTLTDGSVNVLEFKPNYGTKRSGTPASFTSGVRGGMMFLNGKPIP